MSTLCRNLKHCVDPQCFHKLDILNFLKKEENIKRKDRDEMAMVQRILLSYVHENKRMSTQCM